MNFFDQCLSFSINPSNFSERQRPSACFSESALKIDGTILDLKNYFRKLFPMTHATGNTRICFLIRRINPPGLQGLLTIVDPKSRDWGDGGATRTVKKIIPLCSRPYSLIGRCPQLLSAGVAVGAVGGFPGLIGIPGVLEFQSVSTFLDGGARPLLGDDVTKGAFTGDHGPCGGLMLIIMAAETA